MTSDIVDTLKEKYDALALEEYDVEKIVNSVVDTDTGAVENLVSFVF